MKASREKLEIQEEAIDAEYPETGVWNDAPSEDTRNITGLGM